MKPRNNDTELFDLARRELFSCVVGDVLDKLGRFYQFLPPQIQPLRPDMVAIGRAMPVLSVDVFSLALEKARGGKKVRNAIENGMSACAAFEQFGIM